MLVDRIDGGAVETLGEVTFLLHLDVILAGARRMET